MAKKAKKSKKSNPAPMSPDKVIVQRMRSLEIGKCYINKNEEEGMHIVLVTRCHKGGTYSVGCYLLDIFCLGVKNTYFFFNISQEDMNDLVERFEGEEISYDEAHNWVYGAVEFAQEAGINPHSEYKITQYFLEEDTEEIPLIEFEYGKDGKHFFVADGNLELSKYLPILERNLGEGNFDYVVAEDDDEYEEYDEEDTVSAE